MAQFYQNHQNVMTSLGKCRRLNCLLPSCPFIRELTDNIPNWAYYPQLGISNPLLGIKYAIGDWGYMSLVTQSQRTNHQSPIGSNITNWGLEYLLSEGDSSAQALVRLCTMDPAS